MNFAEWLLENKSEDEKIAIFSKDMVIPYRELAGLANAVASKLAESGHNNEKILVFSDNSVFFAASYLGIIGSGCTAVPLDRSAQNRLDYIISKCRARTIFIQKKYMASINQVNGFENVFTDADYENCINVFKLKGDNKKFADVDEKNTAAVIIFTSGSTGVPKGVMLSHYNLYCNTKSIIEYLSLSENDIMMAVLPFTYCYGASWLHTLLRVKGQLVLSDFIFPGKVLNEINEKKCTGFAGVPSTFQILLRKTNFRSMEFGSLRFIAQAGGKLPNTCIREIVEAFPKIELYVMYGQTEATARLSYVPPKILPEKIGSIGKGIPGTILDVVNTNGESAKTGETGEIVAEGGNVMMGYFDDLQATAEAIKNGKLYTGDLGKKDEDGFVYIVGRKKEMIKSAGYRISPKEVEEVIMEMPQIVEAGVIGVEDGILGEAIKAFVAINGRIGSAEIIGFCKKKLPPYKVPKYIEFVASLPKNEMGKVTFESLKELNKNDKQEAVYTKTA